MYKPPENTNRVKSIKSKFENIEKSNDVKEGRNIFKNGTRDNLNMPTNYLEKQECSVSRLNLERQLSDPSKRNIKRTPAFRLDKNTEKVALQRGSVINKSQEFKHILKPINVPKANNCDITPITSESNVNTKVPFITKNNKPILYKSKSSIDFNLIRNKFNSENINNNTVKEPNQRNEECRMKNISALYTEPIPKSLRNKTCDKTIPKPIYSNLDELSDEMKNLNGIENNNIHMCSTLKLTERKKNNNSQNSMTNVTTDKLYGGIPNGKKNLVECNNSDSNSALKKLDHLLELTKLNSLQKTKSERQVGLSLELTDTLKNALKKPLPTGPAPKKPPRTFTHCFKHEPTEAHINNSEKNVSFLHISKNQDSETEKPLCLREKVNLKRNDPKYMLNKLETALRNNKLRYKRNIKTDVSTTSGEDSDDNIVKSISNVEAVKQNHVLVPDNFSKSNNSSPSNNMFVQALNLNCLNSHTCLSPPYSKLNESKSSFFISKKNEEPVYAEPWHFEDLKVKNTPRARSVSSDRNSRNKRNSLYYLSSPVSCSTPRSNNPNAMNNSTNQTDVPSSTQKCRSEKSPSPEVSSLSSFTSDSAASTPMDDTEKSLLASIKIKELIDVFENNTITEVDQTMTNDRVRSDVPEERLNDLRKTLQDTIDTSFEANDSGGGEERKDESERTSMTPDRKLSAEDPTVSKFRSYIKNVSVYSKTRPSKKKSTLFECCLIVEWNADVRRIKFKFPHTVKTPHKIEDLCFPDAACGPLDKTLNAQCYSLVITDDKGERTFGYCRRVVPEGSNKCLPIAYCILSKHKSPRFYRKILIELESRHGISEFHRDNLLRAFYFNTFPEPGETITIKLTDTIACGRNKENYTNVKEESEKKRNSLEDSIESNFVIVNDMGEFESKNEKESQSNERVEESHNLDGICEESGDIILNLHHNPIYGNSDLKDLHDLPTEILQKIFSSLLLERKVILISCLLSKLSSCVEALQAMIYPFTWPYSFIPVLPKSLWDFVEAPTPIICGILSIEVINDYEIEHGIVVDLDEKCILKEEGDEDKALCTSMLKTWRKSITIAKNIPQNQETHSYCLTDAYVNMFAIVLKNYGDYIVNGNFQKEAFIRSRKSKGVRRFLNWFTDTTMFLTFVDAVITNSQDFSQFDEKIALYGTESSSLILDKLLDWKILN